MWCWFIKNLHLPTRYSTVSYCAFCSFVFFPNDVLWTLQSEKGLLLQREKDLNAKAELFDNLKASISKYESRIEELEHQIKDFVIERNELEIKLEETLQDSGTDSPQTNC